MTPELLDFIRKEEGLRLAPYPDLAGHLTIGYGHKMHELADPNGKISSGQAERILDLDAKNAEIGALALVPNLGASPRRLAALTDLVFNVGAAELVGSGLVRCLKAGQWADAAARFRRWDHVRINGVLVENAGLKARREVCAQWIEQG